MASPFRMVGLGSGMDIDAMVEKLMAARRIPLDNIKAKKQILEWQQAQYRELNKKVLALRDNASAILTTSSLKAKKVLSSDTSAVTATSLTNASNATYTVKVTELATTTSVTSSTSINIADTPATIRGGYIPNINLNNTLNSAGLSSPLNGNPMSSFYINDAEITFNPATDTVQDLIDRVNNNDDAGVTMSYRDGRFYIVSDVPSDGSAPDTSISLNDNGSNILVALELPEGTVKGGLGAKAVKVGSTLVPPPDRTKTLASAGFSTDITAGTISINGQNFVINPDIITIDDLIGQINNNKSAGVKLSYDSQGQFLLESVKVGSNARISLSASDTNILSAIGFDTTTVYGSGTINMTKPLAELEPGIDLQTDSSGVFSFKINSVPFKFDKDIDSLQTVIDTINRSAAGVSAYYNPDTDKFTLTAKDTGSQPILLEEGQSGDGTIGNFLSVIGIKGVTQDVGKDALFEINGQTLTSSSNTYEMAGTTFTLVKAGTTATVTVSADIDKIMETIKGFVTAYNDAASTINGKTKEDKYRDFPPLTDAQKEDLKEDEIKKWEEKAKSGLLRNEPYYRSALSQMRSYVTLSVNGLTGRYTQLSQIGITTGKIGSSAESAKSVAQLQIDETALRKALETDQDAVVNLFTYEDPNSTDYMKQGFARRLKSYMGDMDRYARDKAGAEGSTGLSSIIGQKIKDINDSIATLEERMVTYEDRYYKQFRAMEQALNQMNQQSGYLMQQFSNYGQQG